MSNTKHTPEPWVAMSQADYEQLRANADLLHHKHKAAELRISELEEERDELLEALELAFETIKDFGTGHHAYFKVRDTIAKTKGSQLKEEAAKPIELPKPPVWNKIEQKWEELPSGPKKEFFISTPDITKTKGGQK